MTKMLEKAAVFDCSFFYARISRAKLEQHQDIREVLLESGDQELQKIFDTDYYWGTRTNDSGENRMGKLWMKLRSELQ